MIIMSEEEKNESLEEIHEKAESLARYSFTLPNNLVDELERFGQILKMNRSMIVREAVSKWILDNTKKFELAGQGIGVSSYIYNHHDSRVVSDLMSVQHDREEIISSTTHIHLNHEQCFEIVVLKGDLPALRELNDALRSVKGLSFFSDQLIPKI